LSVITELLPDDETAFGELMERYRRELQVHCYRMLGSFDDAEDLVQETLLRAWRGRAGFRGRSSIRTWLYRIATNACLNQLEKAPRRVMPPDVARASADPMEQPHWTREIPWIEPFPDSLLEPAAPAETEPEAALVKRETIEIAYLAAIQHLPPRQRAILVLRDALEWSAKDTASLLETSLASVNSALQRARATLREELPRENDEWTAPSRPTEAEEAVLRRFMEAWNRQDGTGLAAVLRDDVRQVMPPAALWFDGRDAIMEVFRRNIDDRSPGEFRMVATAANRQPAAACYLRPHGARDFRLVGVNLLRIEGGQIVEITTFSPVLCKAFGLPHHLAE
jgi:RNA polymerase sigma-70 factor, ECF subfamily